MPQKTVLVISESMVLTDFNQLTGDYKMLNYSVIN